MYKNYQRKSNGKLVTQFTDIIRLCPHRHTAAKTASDTMTMKSVGAPLREEGHYRISATPILKGSQVLVFNDIIMQGKPESLLPNSGVNYINKSSNE